jgi:hypothetical protein
MYPIGRARFHGVPLCASSCHAWYNACSDDLTCVANWFQDFDWTSGSNICPNSTTCQTFRVVYGDAKTFCERVRQRQKYLCTYWNLRKPEKMSTHKRIKYNPLGTSKSHLYKPDLTVSTLNSFLTRFSRLRFICDTEFSFVQRDFHMHNSNIHMPSRNNFRTIRITHLSSKKCITYFPKC